MWSTGSGLAAGSLLVATPELLDPNFVDSVVLLLDLDEDGALGVVLNRPTPVLVVEVLADWGDLASDPEVLFHGGPVGPDSALAVGRLRPGIEAPTGAFRRLPGSRLGIVDLDEPDLAPRLDSLRIFAGYSGWGADQLRSEVAEGSWYVVGGEPDDPFRHDPSTLWRDVLRRQSGALAWHVTRPLDPGLN